MPDISDFHPLTQKALQTGRMPSYEEIARGTGKTTEEVSCMLREATQTETDETDETDAEPEHPDAQMFRDRYHQLADAKSTEWLDKHPEYGKRMAIPAGVKERIEDDCNSQIQREWKRHLQRFDDQNEDELDTC